MRARARARAVCSTSRASGVQARMAKTPSKKSGKSAKKGAEGKRKKRRVETFSSYIYKVRGRVAHASRLVCPPGTERVLRLRVRAQVLKQVHPDTGISKRAMSIMNRWVRRPARAVPALKFVSRAIAGVSRVPCACSLPRVRATPLTLPTVL